MTSIHPRPAAAVGALAVAVTACLAGSAAVAAPAATPDTAVTISDSAVKGLPATLPAGFHTFTVKQGSKDAREFSVGLLKPGVTVAEVTALGKQANGPSPAPLIKLFKSVSINGGVDTSKGYRTTTHSYTTNLTPGNWVVADTPSNDGSSYFQGFTVVAGSTGSKPKTGAGVTVSDFTFTLASLKSGSQSVVFHNSGRQTHEVSLARIDPGHTQDEVLAALSGNGAPPSWLHEDGYYGLLSPGQSMFATMKLAPKTEYLFVCFLPDYNKPKSYTPHAEEGMYTFLITK